MPHCNIPSINLCHPLLAKRRDAASHRELLAYVIQKPMKAIMQILIEDYPAP